MNYFWGNVFDFFKERRCASLFFLALMACLGTVFAGAIIYQIADDCNWFNYWPQISAGAGLVVLLFFWRVIRRIRACRKDRYKSAPLSRDEISKARSKLIRAKL